MTAPADKLVELLETLPAPTRQEITAWLLDRGTPAQVGGGNLLAAAVEMRAGVLNNALGGALPAGEESQLVTFRLPTERHAELRAWCAEHGFTMAAVVRGLIERFLEDQLRRK
ncbi:hypothetical protein AB0J72_48360 [Dactylosporangium sp. NPDC049742]|uniref:hypothetical protein n=1 Tax=Dactylosporangium sp. NPDC049742 TaxID=3154737 RepID=UPI0034165D34